MESTPEVSINGSFEDVKRQARNLRHQRSESTQKNMKKCKSESTGLTIEAFWWGVSKAEERKSAQCTSTVCTGYCIVVIQ